MLREMVLMCAYSEPFFTVCFCFVQVPTRHTLYIPPFTIHSNDYLRGTWRTMLSDEVSRPGSGHVKI